MVRVEALDHIVLTVADQERALSWYCDALGLEPLRHQEWRRGEAPFPSARIDEGTIIDFMTGERRDRNLDHFCLVIEPVDLDELAASGRFDVVSGPAPRWGARGEGQSLYVLDPDGNVIELRHYG
jgi:catechol 2,3-dioxygenase-like lactoylglutathione lyase family enzyme